MEVPIDVPDEIKGEVIARLTDSKVIRRIERRIQFGLNIAIDEIEEAKKEGLITPNQPSRLQKKPLRKIDKNEREALRRILVYLQEKELNYTLACLKEEVGSIQRKRQNIPKATKY